MCTNNFVTRFLVVLVVDISRSQVNWDWLPTTAEQHKTQIGHLESKHTSWQQSRMAEPIWRLGVWGMHDTIRAPTRFTWNLTNYWLLKQALNPKSRHRCERWLSLRRDMRRCVHHGCMEIAEIDAGSLATLCWQTNQTISQIYINIARPIKRSIS